MSELQLSDQLIEAITKTLTDHDQRASDEGIAVQYLAAIIGFVVGKQTFPAQDKKEFIEHLYAFSNHVLDDVSQDNQQATPPPQAPQQEAFGIWKPSDN